MATLGSIATQMYMAMRDIESALQQLASALNLPPYEAPAGKYRDRAYADMVRMRSLATYLNEAVGRLEQLPAHLVAQVGEQQVAAIQRLLAPLTKEQLVKLAADFEVEISGDAKKDAMIAALVEAVVAPADQTPEDAPEPGESEEA